MTIKIRVQNEDFSLDDEYRQASESSSTGAVVSFVGKVRDLNLGDDVLGLSLEHYPGMTEKVLTQLAESAKERWSLSNVTVIHRIGDLTLGEQIVLVIVTSEHRGDAFSACEYLMDLLKTQAPFWKKEITKETKRWLASRDSDRQSASKW